MHTVEDSSCFVERRLEPLHRFGAYLFYFYLRKRWRSWTVSIETASRPSVDDDGQRTINIWLQLKCCKLHFCGLETNLTAGVTFSLMLQFFWISLLQCDVSFSPKRGNECRRSTLNIFFFVNAQQLLRSMTESLIYLLRIWHEAQSCSYLYIETVKKKIAVVLFPREQPLFTSPAL